MAERNKIRNTNDLIRIIVIVELTHAKKSRNLKKLKNYKWWKKKWNIIKINWKKESHEKNYFVITWMKNNIEFE